MTKKKQEQWKNRNELSWHCITMGIKAFPNRPRLSFTKLTGKRRMDLIFLELDNWRSMVNAMVMVNGKCQR